MFKNNLKSSFTSIKKNAWFSGINIVGLASSMYVRLLMIPFLSEIYSFNRFHEQHKNIYRVTTEVEGMMHIKLATSSYYIGHQLKDKVAGIDQVLVLRNDLKADLKIADHAIAVKDYYAAESISDVFSYELLKGNPASALSNTNGIVLTASTAQKLFGDQNPIGKTVSVGSNQDFETGIVTGIMLDPPINSHLQFEALVSMKTVENSPIPRRQGFKNDPEDCWSSYVYLVLNENADHTHISAPMEQYMEAWNSQWDDSHFSHASQPLSTFVTDPSYRNLPGPTFSKSKIYIMTGLTLFVLLSACFNYTNLSFARAMRRFKEVGVRKVNGANRFQIFIQFITEAVLMALIALIIGLALFFLIKSRFLELGNPTDGNQPMFALDITALHLIYFLVFAVVIGFIAEFLPAFLLSRLKASALFNDLTQVKFFTSMGIQKVLIAFQFTLSIGLIMCAVLVHKQYKYVMDYDLGFETENILQIEMEDKNLTCLKMRLSKYLRYWKLHAHQDCSD